MSDYSAIERKPTIQDKLQRSIDSVTSAYLLDEDNDLAVVVRAAESFLQEYGLALQRAAGAGDDAPEDRDFSRLFSALERVVLK